MPQLVTIQKRIHAVDTIQKLTSAIKTVTAAKLAKSKVTLPALLKYGQHIKHLLSHMVVNHQLSHVLMQPKMLPKPRNLIIILGPSQSMCGAFVSHMLKKTKAYCIEHAYTPSNTTVLPIGKMIYPYWQKSQYTTLASYLEAKEKDMPHLANFSYSILCKKSVMTALHYYMLM